MFDSEEDGKLFINALDEMVKERFFVVTPKGWDCLCIQADVKRFCETFDFNKWRLLARYFTIKGKKINPRSYSIAAPFRT